MSVIDEVLGFKRVRVQLSDNTSNKLAQSSSAVVAQGGDWWLRLPVEKCSACRNIFVQKYKNLDRKYFPHFVGI